MTDLYHFIGGDLDVSATGDVLQVEGLEQTSQRILRRLLTNQGDYIWHPNYGAGVGKKIGTLLDVRAITGLIRSQIFLEANVARTPAPVITVTEISNGISVRIQYYDGSTGKLATLAFDVNR
ncbi:phage tail protein [Variovorax sp. LjRoot84]|uniref:phage tail protein n=1 Tax=Variovorax sp. LjRoot84 TaxID=3342340 RepID=UPI003ECE89BC